MHRYGIRPVKGNQTWYNGAMVDRETFADYVAQALARIHDRPYLQGHALGRLLCDAETARGEALQRALRDGIEALKPDMITPEHSPAWRRYRHLILRYIEGSSHPATARELLVSVRQAHRDHAEAVALLTEVLWGRYCSLHTRRHSADGESDRSKLTSNAALDAELFKLATQRPSLTTDVLPVVRGVSTTVGPLVAMHGASLDTLVPDSLPAVYVAPVVLRQILLGLLTWSVECYSGASIVLRAVTAGGHVEVAITIQQGSASRKPMERPDLPRSGTLLDISRRLAEMQGATIQVDHSSDPAVEIVLTLPVPRTTAVLVVDDNPDVGRLFRRYLRAGAYSVTQATTAAHALRLVHDAAPDVVIMDVLMPSEDGWQVLQQMKANPATRDVPVIVCSVMPERSLAEALGAVDFLEKPVQEAALIAALERLHPTQSPS